jgi:hypothetical protein
MTRTERLLVKARRINDRLAIAVLEGDRTWTPDPETPMLTARLMFECGKRPDLGIFHRLVA